jgi:hypothetical protein
MKYREIMIHTERIKKNELEEINIRGYACGLDGDINGGLRQSG